MIVNQPLADWVTVTGSTPAHVSQFAEYARERGEVAERAKIPRYKGWRYGSIFLGVAEHIHGRGRHLATITGGTAHGYMLIAEHRGGRCSRLDLQITLPLPAGWDARREVVNLSKKRWATGKPIDARIQEGTDGTASIYAGSRKSEREFCIYVKRDGDGNEYLRWEVRFRNVAKRRLASNTFGGIIGTSYREGALATALYDALSLLDTGWRAVKLPLRAIEQWGRGVLDVHSVAEPESDKMEWIRTQVDPAVRRLLADHDTGADMRIYVAEWLRYSLLLDEHDDGR